MTLQMARIEGLSSEEAQKILKDVGKNSITERKRVSWLSIFFQQFEEPIILIFIAAAVMSGFLGETLDFTVISLITFFIIILGFIQEYKAEEALEKLKDMSLPTAKVLRDGKLREIDLEHVVPGDIVVLHSGDMVPADCKVIESAALFLDESMLTGESLPVEKKLEDEIYRGTIVVRGNARAIVAKTGMHTKFGKIAQLLGQDGESSIKKKSKEIATVITRIVLWGSGLTALIGLARGSTVVEMVSIAIATAIAGIPESLPLTTTVVLAIGVYGMTKKNSIVRRMSAVEELGLITFICTDKTGTLTKNQMTVEKIWAGGKIFTVTGLGYEIEGKILSDDKEVSNPDLESLLIGGILCNNSDIVIVEEGTQVAGDPTEIALLVAARKYGLNEDFVRVKFPKIGEIPFSSKRRCMLTIHSTDAGKSKRSLLKGALEVVLDKCSHIRMVGRDVPLTKQLKKEIREIADAMADKSLRILAAAYNRNRVKKSKNEKFVFAGFYAMEDPPKEGVKEAIELAKRAGIRVAMITGDNPKTARSIAEKIGIEGDVITGRDFDKFTDKQLSKELKDVGIFARIDPEDKLRIVEGLRKQHHVVAMVGDGVNDAPALKEADVGVAMGKRGTEVAKGASDIIIADDDFSTLVEAIRMGRNIYYNIQKFTAFLLSWNLGVTGLILLSVLLFGGSAAVFLPLQILFLNVVLEDLPAIALGLDSPEKNLMELPPRNPKEKFLPKKIWALILGFGMYMCLMSLAVFLLFAYDLELARTMAFAVFSLFVIFNVFNFRSLQKSTLFTALRKNWFLLIAILASFSLTLLAMYTPGGMSVFKFVPLDVSQWVFSALVAFSVLPMGELLKKSIFSKQAVE
ncbi:MAG: cation-transporting P-type ATPase [Candidatus Altiarchaeota archaeon]|nr:cation-transporting P-type ATPase [Candidatus Altiarchaeota archaeon]